MTLNFPLPLNIHLTVPKSSKEDTDLAHCSRSSEGTVSGEVRKRSLPLPSGGLHNQDRLTVSSQEQSNPGGPVTPNIIKGEPNRWLLPPFHLQYVVANTLRTLNMRLELKTYQQEPQRKLYSYFLFSAWGT